MMIWLSIKIINEVKFRMMFRSKNFKMRIRLKNRFRIRVSVLVNLGLIFGLGT